MNSDFKDILRALNENRVKYLVVGGYAVIEYTEPRYTKDLDIWVSPDRENAEALFKALGEFGAPLFDTTVDDFTVEGNVFQIGVSPIRVDILMSIDGVRFEDAWPQRVAADFDGVPANMISRSDLITNKRAAGRPQDLRDARLLARSEQLEKKRKPKKRDQA